jgi:hypothetical protein
VNRGEIRWYTFRAPDKRRPDAPWRNALASETAAVRQTSRGAAQRRLRDELHSATTMVTCSAPAAGKVLAEPKPTEGAFSWATGMSSATNAPVLGSHRWQTVGNVYLAVCPSRSVRPVRVPSPRGISCARLPHGGPQPASSSTVSAGTDSESSLSLLSVIGEVIRMPTLPQEREETPETRPSQASTSLVNWSVSMSTRQQRVITTKVFRGGETPPEDDWIGSSVAERIDAVWELTRQCLAWNQAGTDEPRLQRSVSRVQRPSR